MFYRLLAVLLLTYLSVSVSASTILRIGSLELVNKAEMIFEGEVLAVRPEMDASGNIITYVDFTIHDVIKGDADPGSIITLRFTGGRLGGVLLDLGVAIPQEGESGIYFVESTHRPLINPLLGWSQGHFRIAGSGRIIAGDNNIVVDVKGISSQGTTEISRGIAKGVSTIPDKQVSSRPVITGMDSVLSDKPLSIDEFKKKIQDLIE